MGSSRQVCRGRFWEIKLCHTIRVGVEMQNGILFCWLFFALSVKQRESSLLLREWMSILPVDDPNLYYLTAARGADPQQKKPYHASEIPPLHHSLQKDPWECQIVKQSGSVNRLILLF